MSVFPSLPSRATLEDLFGQFPAGAAPLLELHDVLLRSEASLSIGERELIAAYVSALNTCEYCFGAHRVMAQAFGIETELIDALVADVATAPVSDLMKALLNYAAKVTRRDSVLPSDLQSILNSGGTEEMAQQVLMITCLYNFMNRLVDGAQLSAKLSYTQPTAVELQEKRDGSYREWGRKAGFLS